MGIVTGVLSLHLSIYLLKSVCHFSFMHFKQATQQPKIGVTKMSKLKEKIPYSPAETQMLKILRQQRTTDIKKLSEIYYDGRQAPFHAEGAVRVYLRALELKVARNKEPFRIVRGIRRGPYPTEIKLVSSR
jgi:hypothetical protein